jgi:hypothetical protein
MHVIDVPSANVNATAAAGSSHTAPATMGPSHIRRKPLEEVMGVRKVRCSAWVKIAHAYVIAPRRILKVPRIRPIAAIVGFPSEPLPVVQPWRS